MSPTSSKKVPSSAAPISITVGRLSRLAGARKAPIPTEITPQLATLSEDLPTGRDWLFEIKWDGIRCLSYLRRGGQLDLVSRNGTSLTEQFPELKQVARSLHAEEAVLDGEIVFFDEHGRSDFQALQPRIMSTKHSSASSQAVLILFDLLYFDGYDLRNTSLEDRVRLLNTLVEESPVVRLSSHSRNGRVLLDFAKKHGLEGILANDARSHYETRRSTSWRKIKLVREQDCVICGFTTQKRESFASLILGVYQDQKLIYIGNVGTGFDAEQQQILRGMFEQRLEEQTPFAATPKIAGKVTWLRPELVARIKYTQWTKEDRLRAPVFLGLRNDITPQQCVREESALPPPVGVIPTYAQENGAAQVVKAAKRSNLAEIPPQ
jgi:bifunctional non-homologous end joining protein LigD